MGEPETMNVQTRLIGSTVIDFDGLTAYLGDTDQLGFLDSMAESPESSEKIKLISFFAKLCYRSLVLGKNSNVSKIRAIHDNFKSIIDSGHGSVLEHITFNFISYNVSRVFTHELVRHRVGTAFSQESGRYCAIDESTFIVEDPILEEYGIQDDLRAAFEAHKQLIMGLYDRVNLKDLPFDKKKKLTSAIRRYNFIGQNTSIGWSANLRTLRHLIELRTQPGVEWEIRCVFRDVADILNNLNPLYLYGGSQLEDGTWKGLRV